MDKCELNKKREDNRKALEALHQLELYGTMDPGEVQEHVNVRKKQIVEEHQKNHKITLGSDGRWRTRLPDGSKKGRLVAKTNRKDLDEEIVVFYSQSQSMTLKDLFPEWIKYKKTEARASSYIAKIKSDWQTYYKSDETFISRPIDELTPVDIELWADEMIKKYDMDKKTYYNTSMIARQALKYAKKKGYISKSPFDEAEVNTRLFRKVNKAPSESQVYTVEEQKQMEEEMLRLFNQEPQLTVPLAIILMFYTGLRCGELVALKKSDIEGSYIHVQRQETRKYEDVDDEHSKMTGYQIVDYTKSDAGDRKVPIVPYAAELIRLILETNEKYGWKDDDFLFVYENERIHHGAIEKQVLNACDRLGIMRKTPHKFRKTYISTLFDNGVPLDAIRKIVGHEDDQTTLKCYCFSRFSEDQTYDKVAEALKEPDFEKSVTPCNTKVVEFPQNKKCETPA